MKSPLAQVILSLFGGYFIILLFLSVYDWIEKEYPRRPDNPSSSACIHHSYYHQEAVEALKRFNRLTESEKTDIKNNLESNLIPMEQWLAHLGRSDYQIICMGELHEEATRNFLAKEFFAKFSTDVLLLEATPNDLKRLIKRLDDGREYFPLLDADIMSILHSVNRRNPATKIRGIEETDEQQNGQHDHSSSRDQSIAHNFWKIFQPGRLHIILFGALHCTNEPNWLFKNLCNEASTPLQERMLNVRVLGEHQNGPVEAFVYFLSEIGIEKKQFVIPNTQSLPPRIYELFQMLNQETLGKYSALIVFSM
jgi:hypothetical protein